MRRIVLGEVGDEGPGRCVDPLARDLRDAGHEVVYTGGHQSPAQLAATAVQEDADLVGLCVEPGADAAAGGPTMFRELLDELRARDASDIAVFVAGAIGDDEAQEAERVGVARAFPEGARIEEITGWVGDRADGRG